MSKDVGYDESEKRRLIEKYQRDYAGDKEKDKLEQVNHPAHYGGIGDIECIDVIEHMNFNRGSAIKYLWRAGKKNDEIEDLRKAIWYIEREIKRITPQEK